MLITGKNFVTYSGVVNTLINCTSQNEIQCGRAYHSFTLMPYFTPDGYVSPQIF